MNTNTSLLLLASTHALAAHVTSELAPVRHGTLHYVITENSLVTPEGSRIVTGHYQNVCQGEVKVPVFDMTIPRGDTAIHPQQIKCKVGTDDGPMEVVLGLYGEVRQFSEFFEKARSPAKVLNVSFSLRKNDGDSTRSISNNYFSTHTRDVAQATMALQTQTDSIITQVGTNDVTDTFSIRTVFIEDELTAPFNCSLHGPVYEKNSMILACSLQ